MGAPPNQMKQMFSFVPFVFFVDQMLFLDLVVLQ